MNDGKKHKKKTEMVDNDDVEAMTKKELAQMLKGMGLSADGTKTELKLRLCNHLKTTVATMENDDNENASTTECEKDDDARRGRRLESEFNDADASDDDVDERFAHIKQLEMECRQQLGEVNRLRSKLQNTTSNGVRNTNTKAKRVENDETVAQSEPRRDESARVNDRVQDDVRVRSTNRAVLAAKTDDYQTTSDEEKAALVEVVRKRKTVNAVFSVGDIEEAFNTFNGDDEYTVKSWIWDMEQSASVFKWSDVQLLVYARRLTRGSAKQFLRTVEANTWIEMRSFLNEKFGRRTTRCTTYVESRRVDGICFSCGDEGHIAATCPRRQDGVKCFNCNNFGHRSAECARKTEEKTTTAHRRSCDGVKGTASKDEDGSRMTAYRRASSNKTGIGAVRRQRTEDVRLDFARNSISIEDNKDVKGQRRKDADFSGKDGDHRRPMKLRMAECRTMV